MFLAGRIRIGITLAAAGVFSIANVSHAHATLVGLYTFDSASTLGVDSSGNGNNLITYGSGATWTSSGASGGGLQLDGSSYLSTVSGNAPTLFPIGSSAYTLSVTFKTSTDSVLGLIGWGTYGTYDETNALRTIAGFQGGQGLDNYWWGNDIIGRATVADNVFHTATVSYDGITRDLYLDGTLLASDTPAAPNTTAQNFAIGLTAPTLSEYFTGVLDNVAVFSDAETPNQVAAAIAQDADPVPEPASWALMLSGLALTIIVRRRHMLRGE